MARIKTKGEGVSTGNSAPAWGEAMAVADFLAKETGQTLARCAQWSPDLQSPYYAHLCFLSFDNLMEAISYHGVGCYLDAVLLAVKNTDIASKDTRVTDYILRESREWFDSENVYRYEQYATLRRCKIVRHAYKVRSLLKASLA